VYVYATDKAGNRSLEETITIITKSNNVSSILDNYTKDNSRGGEITAPFTRSTPTTVYSKVDADGTSYVFAGENPNNWVKLGNIYFRIIRFNGNGSMRLIYSGEGKLETNGTGTQIGTKLFNVSYNNNMYVGLQYTNGNAHGTGTNSTILGASTSTDTTTLYGWYNSKIKPSYSNLIDTNAGFCSDRRHSTSSSGVPENPGSAGTGTTRTYYRGYLVYQQGDIKYTPDLLCPASGDNLKLPVGLITADEYALAGGGSQYKTTANNMTFWLHTGEDYWTMTPVDFDSSKAFVYSVWSLGYIGGTVNSAEGVRPVINLKATTTFLDNGADGTSSKPYVVKVS